MKEEILHPKQVPVGCCNSQFLTGLLCASIPLLPPFVLPRIGCAVSPPLRPNYSGINVCYSLEQSSFSHIAHRSLSLPLPAASFPVARSISCDLISSLRTVLRIVFMSFWIALPTHYIAPHTALISVIQLIPGREGSFASVVAFPPQLVVFPLPQQLAFHIRSPWFCFPLHFPHLLTHLCR